MVISYGNCLWAPSVQPIINLIVKNAKLVPVVTNIRQAVFGTFLALDPQSFMLVLAGCYPWINDVDRILVFFYLTVHSDL